MSQQRGTNDVVRLTRVVNKPKLTTLLYGATGLLFLFLIVRVFAVTSLVTTKGWHLQVEEARSLVVSLDPTDLFSIVWGYPSERTMLRRCGGVAADGGCALPTLDG